MAHNGAAVPEATPSLMPVFKCKVNALFDLEEACANSLFDLGATCGNPLFDLEEACGNPLFDLGATCGNPLFDLGATCGNPLFDLGATCGNPLFEDYLDSPNTDNNEGEGLASANCSSISCLITQPLLPDGIGIQQCVGKWDPWRSLSICPGSTLSGLLWCRMITRRSGVAWQPCCALMHSHALCFPRSLAGVKALLPSMKLF